MLHLAPPTRPTAAQPGCPPPPRPAAGRSTAVHVASVRPGDSRGLMMTVFATTSTTCTHPAAPNKFDSNRLVACLCSRMRTCDVCFGEGCNHQVRGATPGRQTGILPGASGASRKRATLMRLAAGSPNRGEPFTDNKKKSLGSGLFSSPGFVSARFLFGPANSVLFGPLLFVGSLVSARVFCWVGFLFGRLFLDPFYVLRAIQRCHRFLNCCIWFLISLQSLHAMGLYINKGGLHVRTQAI